MNDPQPARLFEEGNSQVEMSDKKVYESEQKTKSKNKNKKQNSKKSKPQNEQSSEVMHIYRIK